MKTRSPRSSFHHAAVIRSGCRRSSSRATATAAARTSYGVPPRLEADVHVHAAVARRLRVAGDAELVEQRVHLRRRRADVVEVVAGLRVEVEAQLVGVLGVVGEVRPDVEAEAADVDGPRRRGRGRRRPARATSCRSVCSRSSSPATRAPTSGTRFWKNDEPSAPSGKRCSSVGPAAHRPHQRLGDRAGSSGRGRAWSRRARRRTPCRGCEITTSRPSILRIVSSPVPTPTMLPTAAVDPRVKAAVQAEGVELRSFAGLSGSCPF